ncbi:MAG: hypothetical protein GMKNLPBB_01820 [Myxococcota bacterium]|nr:hypothetical protein [Myxococcota bacterium]
MIVPKISSAFFSLTVPLIAWLASSCGGGAVVDPPCASTSQCPPGAVCVAAKCVQGAFNPDNTCRTDVDCPGGKICRKAVCVDRNSVDKDGGLIEDIEDLPPPPDGAMRCGEAICSFLNAEPQCIANICRMGPCLPDHYDVNKDARDGCEIKCSFVPAPNDPCDGKDNNCDGRIDEDTDLRRDPKNCGECGKVCPGGANSQSQCRGGICTLLCNPGYFNNDGKLENGCEAEVCEQANNGVELCNGIDDDCDAKTADGSGDRELGQSCNVPDQGGECSSGKITCVSGKLMCRSALTDVKEQCDGRDNNCNGVVDDNAAGCLPGQICSGGRCLGAPSPDAGATDTGGGDGGTCKPDCTGKECGPNGCGGFCGACINGETCNAAGECVFNGCTPNCTGKTCGDNGCGGACGDCDASKTCSKGLCVTAGCTPKCEGRECGSDGCGGRCGACPAGKACDLGTRKCIDFSCTPDCTGKKCGSDNCSGTCGSCAAGQNCVSGNCVTGGGGGCTPNCAGKVCGSDGCGDVCGNCPAGQLCDTAGKCIPAAGGGCTRHEDCPKFQACDTAGKCISGGLNAACKSDDECYKLAFGCNTNGAKPGTCFKRCAGKADCPADEQCRPLPDRGDAITFCW